MSGNGSERDPSFEDRLRAARQRVGQVGQGQEARPSAGADGGAAGLGFGLRAGVELVAAEVVAGAIGYGLDHLLHTLPLFLVIFILLGGAAGVMNVWRMMTPTVPGRKGGRAE
jgi:ATP synthase protein I